MTDRLTLSNPSSCIICSEKSATSCRNCETPHCDVHMMGGRCAGCEGALWHLERHKVKRTALVYSVLAAPSAAAAVAVGVAKGLIVSATVGFAVPALALAGLFAVTGIAPLVIRRVLAGKTLPPSSVPMPPPSQFDGVVESKGPKTRPRSRSNMRIRRPRPPRAVFMTRGGYFYQ